MADATIRPVSAGTGNWDLTTVANINEAITQPSSAGDGTYARHNGASTKIQEWNLTAPSDAGTIIGVIVWMRVSAKEFGDNEMSVRIKTNGTWHSLSCTSDPFLSDIEEWKSYTGTFSGGAMVGSAPVLEVTGAGTSSSSRGYIHNAYAILTYTPAPAEQYAVKSGNWNDTTVWSTGAVPTTGTVYSNNYTVTVNVDSTATVVTNVAGTVAVAGGGFALADGVTLTANCYAGAATCVTAGSGVGGAIVGDIYGGSSTNAYGFQKLGSVLKTVTVTGNSYGGTGTGATAILNSSNGPINQTGNAYGGTTATAFGHRNSGSATDTITGHSYAGDAAYGAFNGGSGNITVTGNSYAADSVAGSANGASGNLTIGTNAVGGTSSTSYGVYNYGSGTVTVTGAAISADSPGLGPGIANTGSGYSIVGSVVTGTSGVSPCVGRVHVADLSAFTALVRSSASSVTLSAEVGLPSPFEPSPVFGAV
jgi:hypothetical protein